MAIESICKGCARKLRVDDQYAGRKARCPHCRTIYTVPGTTAGNERVDESAPGSGEGWLLRTSDGAVYGPASKAELDAWVREGRLDAASRVRQEGAADWRPAVELYPSLAPAVASGANPFAEQPATAAPESNPYSSPLSSGRGYREHRGGLILILGVLGLACCQLFSIAAWIMGYADMKEIDAGRMDPAGRGLTQAGMIIGIVGTVLLVLVGGMQLTFLLFVILSGM